MYRPGPAADAAQVAAVPPALERTHGVGRIKISATGIEELYQQGALRLRVMRAAAGAPAEVVAINTAGGLTGGDVLDLTLQLGRGAAAVLTTPACEKIYRATDGDAVITNRLRLDDGGRLDWLPQPMILFDRARVRRRLDVDLAANATLLAVEGVILGRTAMGEETSYGDIHDALRIRRAGRLVYADAFRAAGAIRGALGGSATLGGARAFAMVLLVSPEAEQRLDEAREALAGSTGETGASAWNGMMIVRFLAPDGQALIGDLAAFLSASRGASLPRSWLC